MLSDTLMLGKLFPSGQIIYCVQAAYLNMKGKQGWLRALTPLIQNTVTLLSKMLTAVSLLYRIVSSNLLWLFGFALPQATYLHNEHLQLEQCIVEPNAQR